VNAAHREGSSGDARNEEIMKLTSRWNGGSIFVRVFGPKDTVYLFGRWETVMKFGQTVDFNLPEGQLQFEVKKGGVFGDFIIRPGKVWRNSEEVVLNADGELVKPDPGNLVDIDADLDVHIQYIFNGQKTEFERLTRTLHLSGPADPRRVDIDEIKIVRDATTTVSAIHGSFKPGTGEVSLSAEVAVSFLVFVGRTHIGLTTGQASSGSAFSGNGAALDRATRKFVLVGGGRITDPIQSELFVTINGTLRTLP
jgi:hypothetical protein